MMTVSFSRAFVVASAILLVALADSSSSSSSHQVSALEVQEQQQQQQVVRFDVSRMLQTNETDTSCECIDGTAVCDTPEEEEACMCDASGMVMCEETSAPSGPTGGGGPSIPGAPTSAPGMTPSAATSVLCQATTWLAAAAGVAGAAHLLLA